MSRSVEACTSSRSRHFISKSYKLVRNMFDAQEYTKLVKFVLETVNEILKQERRAASKAGYFHADYCVLLDSCMRDGLIVEASHASLMRLYEIFAGSFPKLAFEPKTQVTQLVKSNSWTFSQVGAENELEKEDATEALMILFDFLRVKQEEHEDARYEPYLTLFAKDIPAPSLAGGKPI